jgi:hypothetical protein
MQGCLKFIDHVGWSIWKGLQHPSGPTIAILLFVATQIIALVIARRTAKKDIKRTISGIYLEIWENANLSSKLLDKNMDDVLKDKLQSHEAEAERMKQRPFYRPFIIITESSKFYEAVSAHILSIDEECLKAIRAYYRDVADLHLLSAGVASDTFLCISIESKCSTIDDFWRSLNLSKEHSTIALGALTRRYPKWCKN